MTLPPCPVLEEMVRSKRVQLPDGQYKDATAGLGSVHAWALYQTVLDRKPKLVVEIGMAQGFSTLSILCALNQTGGRLVSIDPYIGWPSGRKAALHAVAQAGYAHLHTHMEAKSYEALPKLLDQGCQVDLGYIDGNHAFEHAFIDFFYLDRMLTVGGILGLNNAGWPSVHRVIRYLQTQRKYREMNVGLKPDYRGRNVLVSIVRRILNRPRQDRYFRKLESVEL